MIEQKALLKAAGKRLASARAQAGYANQRALADAFGISEPAVAKYEQGAREIPMSLLHWLSERHGISAEWIITGNTEPEAANENMIRIKHYNVSAAAGTGGFLAGTGVAGLSVGATIAVGAAVAAVAVAASDNDSTTNHSTTTHH